MAPTKLNEHLTILYGQYLEKRKQRGGSAQGWRTYAMSQLKADQEVLALYSDELIFMALDKKWREPPRRHGPDLFSFGDYTIPETITRIAKSVEYVDGDDIEEDAEEKFEKVDYRYATVGDFIEDSNIKLRKAAQSSARANACAIAADLARKRAKGNLNTFLHEIADEK